MGPAGEPKIPPWAPLAAWAAPCAQLENQRLRWCNQRFHHGPRLAVLAVLQNSLHDQGQALENLHPFFSKTTYCQTDYLMILIGCLPPTYSNDLHCELKCELHHVELVVNHTAFHS